MNYLLKEIQTELRKRLLDVDTMIKWNDFLDMVEEKPRKVMVIYGYKMDLGKPNERTMYKLDKLGIGFTRLKPSDFHVEF